MGVAAISLRASLDQIGEPGARPGIHVPSDFFVAPSATTTLRALMRAMVSPRPDQWVKRAEGQFFNKDWTEECQGVAHDDQHWYISSNKSGKQRVYRFSLAQQELAHVKLAGNGSGHLGDLDYHDGRIYCAMEQPVQIVVIETPPFTGFWSAKLLGAQGGPPPQNDCPWCAIHPWNGLLYSSGFGGSAPGTDVLHAYRLNLATREFRHVPESDIHLASPVRRVQGAAFSDNGHVVIASDHTNDIRCFSTLNGAYRGRAKIQKDGGSGEEVEGITIWESVTYDGQATQVHVMLLDNDWPDSDDIYFKHYQVPVPADL